MSSDTPFNYFYTLIYLKIMQTWIIYALLSALAAGVHSFMFKVVIERNYSPNLVNALGYLLGVILMWGYVYYLTSTWIIFPKEELIFVGIFAFLNALFYNLSVLTRIKSLRNIDTVIFFPLYKTFWPILVTMISIFVFKEYLSFKEALWIVIGICIPLMLLTKTENKIQKNLSQGLIFLLITVLFSTIGVASAKIVAFYEYSLDLFIFMTFTIGMLLSWVSYLYEKNIQGKTYNSKGLTLFVTVLWITHIASYFFFAKALEWNFAIVFTINSFYILIPIILSIVFYWEHFNMKKAIVIILSIISILLFI